VIGLRNPEGRSNRVLYLAAVTPSQVQQHIEALLSGLETRMLVVGNIYKDEAIALAKLTEEVIPANPLPGLGPVDLSLELPEGMSPYSLRLCPVENPSSFQVPIMFGPIPYLISMSLTLP
jgi:hypothetical protein